MSKKFSLFIPIGKEICDPNYLTVYTVRSLLGRGAFAQCYLATIENGEEYAIKVVKLSEIKNTKLREKLDSEISIHQSLNSPHIVKMYRSFRDSEFLYMVLEYCKNGGMDALLKRHKSFSEQQVRVFTTQILDALEYLHEAKQVVHRDLKLGNLFLDNNNNIKLGDFGLAAVIKEGQKKRTICGTPNYIAPEVLFDKDNGHSFEVDIWSLGVIIYTLLVGVPPFQKKDVKEIYKMIEANSYIFPKDSNISQECKQLISSILTTNPMERPTLTELRRSRFLSRKETMFAKILRNLGSSVTAERPNIDYLVFSIPLSKIKGVGYILISGYHGIYFSDHSNILSKVGVQTFTYIGVRIDNNRKILRKEEHATGKVPEHLVDKYERLKYFIRNFKSNKWKEDVEASFIVRIKRMENGLIHGLWNNLIVLDYNDGLKIMVYDEGRKIWATDGDKDIPVTKSLIKQCIGVLKTQDK
ncbi:UNVERIFIED_CONTAM: hypothetical protein PYX00_011814 [Menopon gallinae]|uniref:Protein kinase domain-containing protein n=1 Tax=Menopon gallinae TaxID=328185 RepID=A0AAW2H8U4_9NEOP